MIYNATIIKDIATALIAVSGDQFDFSALDDSDITKKEKDKIINEIKRQCQKNIDKIEKKYNINLGGVTCEIIERIAFE